MKLWSERNRWVLLAAAGVVVALAGLLLAGSRQIRVRTASADAPSQAAIATLGSGHQVCEGPFTSHGAVGGVGIWGAAVGTSARLTVTVKDPATREILSSGSLRTLPEPIEWTVPMARVVPGGKPVEVCVTTDVGSFSLWGSSASDPTVAVTGISSGQRFSLVLLSDRDQSLLGSLSLAFSRAALWRPSWVGPWTFWVLAFAVLMTFGLAVVAVAKAAADDEPPSPPGEPETPIPDAPSEAGQNRPQPVS